jgi:hypothetical protein
MFKHYINLELKAFRSASVGKALAKFDGLLVVYFTCFFSCGIALYPMLSETFPDQNRGYC